MANDRKGKGRKGKGRKDKGSDKGSERTSGQEPFPVQYGCGHYDAEPLKHTVDILVRTVNLVHVQKKSREGLITGHIEFMCVPYVDGSITVELFEMVLKSPGSSPETKPVWKTDPPLEAKQKDGNHKQVVDISSYPVHMIGLKEQYKVEIKTKADKDTDDIKVCELTLAVIEKVKGKIKIRVTDQIVWVGERMFMCHDSTGIYKALNIDYKNPDKCSRCLVKENPAVLEPIGDIMVTTKIIGRGSRATVFNGTFQDRPCAVKRHPITNKIFADNDIKMMTDIGSHSNIVSYIGMAEDDKFVFVAVESCKCSLDKLIASRDFENDEYKLTLEGFKDLVLWTRKKDSSKEYPFTDPCKVYPSEHLLTFLSGIVSGLGRLHSKKISHNNLKSQNVLISEGTTVVDIIPKLSNFSRSTTLGTTGSSSSGGQEPTFPDDLYDLGNLILDCITITCDGAALSKKVKEIDCVTHLPEAHDLITQLQNPDPKLRPTTSEVEMHPFFWGPKDRLDFLYYASECIQGEGYESNIRKPIYEHMDYKNWNTVIGPELLETIKNDYRSYHGVNLVRVIRNKYDHYMTQPKELRIEIGGNLTEFDGYFSSRFPNLLMLVYNIFKDKTVKGKNLLDEYLKPGRI